MYSHEIAQARTTLDSSSSLKTSSPVLLFCRQLSLQPPACSVLFSELSARSPKTSTCSTLSTPLLEETLPTPVWTSDLNSTDFLVPSLLSSILSQKLSRVSFLTSRDEIWNFWQVSPLHFLPSPLEFSPPPKSIWPTLFNRPSTVSPKLSLTFSPFFSVDNSEWYRSFREFSDDEQELPLRLSTQYRQLTHLPPTLLFLLSIRPLQQSQPLSDLSTFSVTQTPVSRSRPAAAHTPRDSSTFCSTLRTLSLPVWLTL